MAKNTIKQSVTIKAKPHDVYEALMDAKKHAKFTGGKAVISREVGGKFNVFDGYAEGVNLELVPDKKIVQSWRADDWPKGHYSKATFDLKAAAMERNSFLPKLMYPKNSSMTSPRAGRTITESR